jgi:HEAT repeat protein
MIHRVSQTWETNREFLASVMVQVQTRFFLFLVCAAVALAQPAGVSLRIEASKTKFYLGEMIPLKLSFTAATSGSFVADTRLQDRVGRMNGIEEFIVDPPAQDPLHGLPGESGGMGGISGGDVKLSPDKPFVVQRMLNEWVRFRSPGKYQVSVRSRRARAAGMPRQPVEALSNVLTLEIEAAPPEWVAGQIKSATAILDQPAGFDDKIMRAHHEAGLRLRFLNTLASATALAKRLPAENSVDAFAIHSGILDSSYRPRLLPVLEELLTDPHQAISGRFLRTLAQLAVLVESNGIMPAYPSQPGTQMLWRADQRQREALFPQKFDEYILKLVDSLPRKDPPVRALTAAALLSVADGRPGQPEWIPGTIDVLMWDFDLLPSAMRTNLLSERWNLLRKRDVLPLLLRLLDSRSQDYALRGAALYRILDLDPIEGRRLVLDEIRRPDGPRVPESVLMSLPDERIPELDAAFAAQVSRGALPGLLIARYATRAIVKEVEAGYVRLHGELERQKLPHCPFPLVFYFLKFDPEFGEQELRKGLANGPCYDMGRAAEFLGRQAMSQELERLAIEYLKSSSVPVKRGAADILGKYGSPDAEKPLWETMQYFSEWWKQSAVSPNQEGAYFERTLASAIAQAGGWYVGETKLQQLQALCSTSTCRSEVAHWIREAQTPRRVEVLTIAGEPRVRLAQYTVTGERELRRKLLQFPRGSTFRVFSMINDEARTRVEFAIRAAGHRIEETNSSR